MNTAKSVRLYVILSSILFALILTVLPLPTSLIPYWPQWVALVLIYWLFYVPEKVGLFFAWVIGLIVDGLQGVLIGQIAFAYVLMAYLTIQVSHRVRLFPLWQQSITVFLLIGCALVFLQWTRHLAGISGVNQQFWYSALTSMVLWPGIKLILASNNE